MRLKSDNEPCRVKMRCQQRLHSCMFAQDREKSRVKVVLAPWRKQESRGEVTHPWSCQNTVSFAKVPGKGQQLGEASKEVSWIDGKELLIIINIQAVHVEFLGSIRGI